MSKKTRKKSPKPASGKAARAQSATSAKTPPSKTGAQAASRQSRQPGHEASQSIAQGPIETVKTAAPHRREASP